jgi:hypothetical protein
MNYQDAEEKCAALAEALGEIAGVVRKQLGLENEANKLDARADQIRADRFRVLVVGEFKRGKSTLLNAMLGDDVLPRKVTECTPIVTVINYAEQPKAQIIFADGREPQILSIEQFRKQYELTIEDHQDRNEAIDSFTHVERAVISYPVEVCRHRVELVDSPGLGAHKARSERVQKFLPLVDAVVFVLNAMQFLKDAESSFLESVLLPLGLRNIFFVINGWNLIDESVLRPEDATRERAMLEEYIQQRLVPFCVINGENRSAERIFRVNALGALKARMRGSENGSLEESNVPAFEKSLQRFLVDDRGRARMEMIMAVVSATTAEIDRFIATQISMANKSIAQVEAERQAIEPKLERLRSIKREIDGFLDSQSANLQDRLAISFQKHVDVINEGLPAAVETFKLEELTQGSMLWKTVTDWTKADDDKFQKKVQRHLEPLITQYLEQQFAVWHQAVIKNEMQAVSIDVERHLQQEADAYRRVLEEIEERLGIRGNALEIDVLVRRWIGGQDSESGIQLSMGGLGLTIDMSWLIAGIVTDIVAHLTLVWAPIIGLLVTGFRLALREMNIRKEMKEKIILGLREELRKLVQSKSVMIREQVRSDFANLKAKIGGNISEEIALIDASLQSIVDRKQETTYSAEREEARLKQARELVAVSVQKIEAAVSVKR